MSDPDRIMISPEVAAELGPDITNRYRTGEQQSTGVCWECGKAVDEADPVAIIIRIQAAGTLPVARLAHPTCSPSDVRAITDDEVRAHAPPETHDGSGGVTAAAGMWPPEGPGRRPVVWMSFDVRVSTVNPAGDATDAFSDWLLAQGWELTSRVGRPPVSRPDGWGMMWTAHQGVDPETGPGHYHLIGPGMLTHEPTVVADIPHLQPPAGWVMAAATAGVIPVYIGPLWVEQWTRGYPDIRRIQQAARSGRLLSARVHIELYRS